MISRFGGHFFPHLYTMEHILHSHHYWLNTFYRDFVADQSIHEIRYKYKLQRKP